MKNILIGISGSIAAYKTILLIRELDKHGYNCRVIITAGGLKFVTPELIAGLGIKVYTDQTLDFTDPNQAMTHINLAKWADLIMLAPASANLIAKLAHGFADNLLGEVILAATGKPVYLAPAMNYQMYANPITQKNINRLIAYGFIICSPNNGIQACGDTGDGRMQEPEELFETIRKLDRNKMPTGSLAGKTILITLGATIEPIDPVRFISNNSSGKMGKSLVSAALSKGANVIAIHGKLEVTLPAHPNLMSVKADNAADMLKEGLLYAKSSDIVIACAAVCDYRIDSIAEHKLKKDSQNGLTLKLIQNPDIIAEIKKTYPKLFCVGFAAETDNLIPYAKTKLQQKKLDMIIANQVGKNKVFNSDNNQITIIDKNGNSTEFQETAKDILAEEILNYIGDCQ